MRLSEPQYLLMEFKDSGGLEKAIQLLHKYLEKGWDAYVVPEDYRFAFQGYLKMFKEDL